MNTLSLAYPIVRTNVGVLTNATVGPCFDDNYTPPNPNFGSVPVVALFCDRDPAILRINWMDVSLEGFLCYFLLGSA